MKNISTSLVFIFSLIVLPSLQAQTSKGAMGYMDDSGKIVELNLRGKAVTDYNYTVQLLPGESFTGYFYFWLVSGNAASANFSESIDAPWLSLSNSSFTSNACNDIKVMGFHFEAIQEGGFSVTAVDANGAYDDIIVTMLVMPKPTERVFPVVVERDINNPAAILNNGYSHLPFTTFGCNPSFAPDSTKNVKLFEFPEVDWLTLSSNSLNISLGDTVPVFYSLIEFRADTFRTLVGVYEQWRSQPTYFDFIFIINNPTSIKDNLDKLSDIGSPYPSPANDIIHFPFTLKQATDVHIKLFDFTGKEMGQHQMGWKPAGEYIEPLEFSNWSSGLYFYQFVMGNKHGQLRKLLIR